MTAARAKYQTATFAERSYHEIYSSFSILIIAGRAMIGLFSNHEYQFEAEVNLLPKFDFVILS